ncbi:MAG: ABC transporter ATP-binding protein [Firmicutes bacterium]|nr:ABC transporter ATP-binding protein [Bacillota bacterium]MDY2720580.1 ABC transporter ATP-binding protein [Candidatus Faecousia sp.]
MKNKPLKKQLIEQFYRGNIPILCLAVFASLASGSLNLILSWTMQQLIDTASGVPGALPIGLLAKLSGGFVLLCIAVCLLSYVSEPRFIRRAMRQYKEFAFQKLTEKSISSFRDESVATYLSALTNDANTIEADFLSQQLSVITKTVTFFGAIALMLWYSPLMTAIAIGVTILPLIASLLTGNQITAAERRVSDRNRDFTAALSDCLGGFAVVKTFKAEREIFRLFAENNRALEGEKFSRRRIKILVGMIGSVAGVLAQLGVFLIGAYLALTDRGLTPGIVIAFVNLMNFMIEPVAELPGLLASRKAARGLISKLAAVLEKNPAPAGNTELPRLGKGIRIQNLSFGYDANKEVLHNLTAEFEAGKAYAVVGSSGSGKSTLLSLLMASGTDYRGEILFDGTELRSISSESLYELISNIQQNVFVFNASIRDNVTMFRSFPRGEIDDAIAHAHLSGLIEERGENYLCGENGKGLSGGEKQRISIARSLLKRSSVLLADEATAALDAETAYQVTSDILDLEGVTRIVVTHALNEALLRRYDGILVLKDGRIEECGSFDELMENRSYFHALFTVAQ